GTTARTGSDYNLIRTPITPEKFSEKIKEIGKNKIALVFGREDSGLTNEELKLCDFIVIIPTSKKNRALNLSHSVAILLYEIFKKSKARKIGKNIKAISRKEKQVILEVINNILNKLDFATKEKKETQKKLWKRLIGKAMLTKRESFALIGFLKKILKNLK
ncbi:RNA methyltransferase, partial [Candidatus Woesearchaeota archaeon]